MPYVATGTIDQPERLDVLIIRIKYIKNVITKIIFYYISDHIDYFNKQCKL